MSLYNLMNGVNPLAIFLIPMLGDKHPDSFPRFRNVFTSDDDHPEYDDHIHVYTRVGGGNRGCGYGEEDLYKHPNFVATFDDDYDCTYASYVFSVPDQFKDDYDLIKGGKFDETSEGYKNRVLSMFPEINDPLKNIFSI